MTHCLIVDDSRVIRRVSRQMLEAFGFTIEEAENGQQGIDRCKAEMPEVVLLDWNMPVMTGIEFITELRMLPGGDMPKVIFCTTENSTSHIHQAINCGADEYMIKPFDQETLKMKLQVLGMV